MSEAGESRSSASRKVTLRAANGPVTLRDLREFVREMDDAGAAEVTQISARVTFGGRLREISAEAVRFGDAAADAT